MAVKEGGIRKAQKPCGVSVAYAPRGEVTQGISHCKVIVWITRQTLGSQDFPENLQKTIFATFADAAKKPSKKHQQTFRRPWKF